MARVVQAAERLPRHCLVSGRERGPFVDFEVDTQPPNPNTPHHLYLHKAVVEEAARKLGMVPKDEVDRLLEQLTGFSEELKELREFMALYGELEAKANEIRGRRG